MQIYLQETTIFWNSSYHFLLRVDKTHVFNEMSQTDNSFADLSTFSENHLVASSMMMSACSPDKHE